VLFKVGVEKMMWRRFQLLFLSGVLFCANVPVASGADRPPTACSDYKNFSAHWKALAAREPAIYETIYSLIQRSGTPWTKTGVKQAVHAGKWVDVEIGNTTPINCVVLPAIPNTNGFINPTTIVLDFVWVPKGETASRQAGMKVDFILGTDRTVALSMCANRTACGQMGIPLNADKLEAVANANPSDYNCNDPFWNELWPRIKDRENALTKMFSRTLSIRRPDHCIQRYQPQSTSVADQNILQVFFDYEWTEMALYPDRYLRPTERRNGLKMEVTYTGDPAKEMIEPTSVESFVLCRRLKECRENNIRFGNN